MAYHFISLFPERKRSAASIAKVFALEGEERWTYVFNCAGENNYGQNDAVYETHVRDLTRKCAAEAARLGVQRFVEISTAQVYDSNSVRLSEPYSLTLTRFAETLKRGWQVEAMDLYCSVQT